MTYNINIHIKDVDIPGAVFWVGRNNGMWNLLKVIYYF